MGEKNDKLIYLLGHASMFKQLRNDTFYQGIKSVLHKSNGLQITQKIA